MSRFARDTRVSVDRSKAEIERVLMRYGAERFAYFTDTTAAAIAFKMRERAIRIRLPLPAEGAFAVSEKGRDRAPAARRAEWERAVRQRWRALLLVVRAKLEAIESGISSFESEFLAYTVLPNGKTVEEQIGPELALAYEGGRTPQILLGIDRGDGDA